MMMMMFMTVLMMMMGVKEMLLLDEIRMAAGIGAGKVRTGRWRRLVVNIGRF